jgi:hypothetical protein
MATFDRKIKQINGPVNIVRMEGEVGGVRKVIYILMNIFYPLHLQTECDNIFSRDISNYLVQVFHGLNGSSRMYDFFLQIDPTNLQNIKFGMPYNSEINPKPVYMDQVLKLFRKLFVFDPQVGKVNTSKSLTNLRFHYIDIVPYINSDFIWTIHEAYHSANSMRAYLDVNLDTLLHIINILQEASVKYKFILDIIRSYTTSTNTKPVKKISLIKFQDTADRGKENPPMTQEERQQILFTNINYLINKIFNSYTNRDVRNKLTQRVETVAEYLEILISDANSMVTSFSKIGDIVFETQGKLTREEAYVSKFNYGLSPLVINDMLSHIWSSLSIHVNKVTFYLAEFTVIYFLRRFLDKAYVTNGVVYMGAFNSWTSISILAKQFDFKITHYSYSSISNIEDLNKKIRETDHTNFGEIFDPPHISQCSDITHFPDKFL